MVDFVSLVTRYSLGVNLSLSHVRKHPHMNACVFAQHTFNKQTDRKTVWFKNEVEFWSCDCIVKETVWNRSEKVDHVAYKTCVLQGSGVIKNVGPLSCIVHRKVYMGLLKHVT